ncbi:MAG: phage tail sheath family protein [Candidatus Merdivicinus sp.]|jgi:hypothetical protein
MAGGSFLSQNKVRAGVYINFQSLDTAGAVIGERGTAALAIPLTFGPSGLVRVDSDTAVRDLFGFSADSAMLRPLRETAKRAAQILVYRLADGSKATGSSGSLTVTAKYGGSRGNDFTVSVTPDGDLFRVETWLDNLCIDSQTVSDITGLQSNHWLDFSGEGELTEQAGLHLSGGTDTEISAEHWTAFFQALETADFQTVGILSDDSDIQAAAVAFVRKMREDQGVKIQAVLANYPQADYEGVISVKNGVFLEDGTEISPVDAVAYVTGMTAGAQLNQSNTYDTYDGAVDVTERFTNSQIIDAIRAGEWVFIPKNGKVVVEQDLNTLTSFTPLKGAAFSKNRVIRVLDTIASDVQTLFEEKYLGKTGNSADGRSLFRAELAGYFSQLQEVGAIDAFDSKEDLEVLPGNTADSVVVNLAIRPVDSMEKLYMTVEIQ